MIMGLFRNRYQDNMTAANKRHREMHRLRASQQRRETDVGNKMSQDRVRFKILGRRLHDNPCYVQVISDCFGIARSEIEKCGYHDKDMTVVCRPSQFARFIIRRQDTGMQNLIKELDAVLFTPKPEPEEYDVSKKPNTVNNG